MPVVRGARMNISGIWQSTNFTDLTTTIAKLLATANLPVALLLPRKLLLPRRKRPARNNIRNKCIISEKISAYPADIFLFIYIVLQHNFGRI
jgi:hypothetical protein